MDGVDVHVSEGVTLVLDSRHFPVIIGTWFGGPTPAAGRAAAEWVERMADRALREEVAFVLVSDSRLMAHKPNAAIRALFAETIDGIDERMPGRFLGMRVIVQSPLMRAAMAMLLWLLRRSVRLTTVASVEDAITQAKLLLEHADVACPEGLDPETYQSPIDPDEMFDEASGAN